MTILYTTYTCIKWILIKYFFNKIYLRIYTLWSDKTDQKKNDFEFKDSQRGHLKISHVAMNDNGIIFNEV